MANFKLTCCFVGSLCSVALAGFLLPELAVAGELFWSFRPVQSATVPSVRDSNGPLSAVDHYIVAKLDERGLKPAPMADKRTLIRRATFDLIGLPPTPVEVSEFLADDSSEAFAKVVERLLASPRYGERWGRHWLDVVRYADARDLIQLPAESDFREAWRYRDWVVNAFNRDLPYDQFIMHQVAGDLLQPVDPARIDTEALVATGMLAIADFVPGDVDKQQMIADYVNDQVDVVGRAFLGLTIACARCHDHKFDPISTEDYYSLAGIFFSTRLVPGPVKGNTPLVRVPLLAPAEIAAREAEQARDKARLTELSQLIPAATDREYRVYLERRVAEESAKYLLAANEIAQRDQALDAPFVAEFAKTQGLVEGPLRRWIKYFQEPRFHPAFKPIREAKLPAQRQERVRELAAKLAKVAAERSPRVPLQATDAHTVSQPISRSARLAEAELFRFRSDDRRLVVNETQQVTFWPNRGRGATSAVPVPDILPPVVATFMSNREPREVLRFSGKELLQVQGGVPPVGSVCIVFRPDPTGGAGQRLLGWEDSAVGQHGLGILTDNTGAMHVVLRRNGMSGDVVLPPFASPPNVPPSSFQVLCITWGPQGVSVSRNGQHAGTNKLIDSVSPDPAITALRIGGPGSGSSPRFQGDIAELRVYSIPLEDADRARLESELLSRWRGVPGTPDPIEATSDLYDELVSPLGPFQLDLPEREKLLTEDFRQRLAGLRDELERLKKKGPPPTIPQAVVVQDGGPPGTPHEGFHDAVVYLRGNHLKPGQAVPRGVPKVIAGADPFIIRAGSGRKELAQWLANPNNPLTARVMVNRIWQHHFGAGLVRTSANFGEMGERPGHPELLDYLAAQFVSSGWSIKAMHRLIMLSRTYQQSSGSAAANDEQSRQHLQIGLATDPENRLLWRANRRRLEVEAIRDSLLAVADRLDETSGGPGFQETATPRRSLYIMSVRTGAKAAEFASLFDAPDCSGIVERRTESIVAPQALLFMNDPQVAELAEALAKRLARDISTPDVRLRIQTLYEITLGRPPVAVELDVGQTFINASDTPETWARYCHLILSTNEFIYVD